MNIKYENLSVIGKVWQIAELLHDGIRDSKDAYIMAAFKKITQLKNDENLSKSTAVKETTMINIMEHGTNILHQSKFKDYWFEFENDESVVSIVWFAKTELDIIKESIKNNGIHDDDFENLKNIYLRLKSILVNDLKSKVLSGDERRDLLKIVKEVNKLVIKVETRIKHSQINIV